MSFKTRNTSNKRKKSESSYSEEEEEYEVEKILESRINPKTKKKEYLVKWENWPISDSTWEPSEHLDNVKHLIAEFESKDSRKPQQSSSRPTKSSPDIKDVQRKKSLFISKNKSNDEEVAETKEDTKKAERPSSQRHSTRGGQQKVKSQSFEDTDEHELIEEQQNQGDDQDPDELVFEEILNKRVKNGNTEYLIKFQNYEEGQWLEENQLIAIKDEIQAFEKKMQSQAPEVTSIPQGPRKYLSNEAQESDNEEHYTPITQKRNNSKEAKSQHPVSKKQTAKRSSVQVEPLSAQSSASKSISVKPSLQAQVSNECEIGQSTTTTSQSISHSSKMKIPPQFQQQAKEGSYTKAISSSTNTHSAQRKRPIDEMKEIVHGDFKTDNIDRVEFLGDQRDILGARFEVFWKTRKDGATPCSQVYSSSYLKRYMPEILIDFLIPIAQQQFENTQ